MRALWSGVHSPVLLSCVLALSTGCSRNYVQSDTALGRIIVYRNGVAYFERHAVLDDDHLKMTVPDAQLDDFLKSLSVHDAATGELAPVSYRNDARGSVDLTVKLAGPAPHRITLSYVTEAPAWKPTYRVTLTPGNKVKLQAWAIVDNVSGEDWNGVRLGVSSGSALSFRYDLRSVRNVARDRLEPEGLAALAPPNGGAAYGGQAPGSGSVVAELDEKTMNALAGEADNARDPAVVLRRIQDAEKKLGEEVAHAKQERDVVKTLCLSDKAKQIGAVRRAFGENVGAGVDSATVAALGQRTDQLLGEANECVGEELAFSSATTVAKETGSKHNDVAKRGPMGGAVKNGEDTKRDRDADGLVDDVDGAPEASATVGRLRELEARIQTLKETVFREKVRLHVLSDTVLGGSIDDAARRGELLRQRLVRAGIPADRVVVDARQGAGGGGVQIVTERVTESGTASFGAGPAPKLDPTSIEPVKTSLFEVKTPMDVPSNSSVMLALYAGETAGESVYYYDAESARGNATFPFRAVRVKNPTASTLESGPVTVIADGRFLGEGVSDPIPAGGWAFIPFAMDRQVVAERESSEDDAIARILSARRGVFTTELKHSRHTRFTFYNRSDTPLTLYLRHTATPGFVVDKAPAASEKIAGADLYRLELPQRGKLTVELSEAKPVQRTTDIRSADGARLLRAYVEGADAEPELKATLTRVADAADEIGKLEEQLSTKREQQKEYRNRMNELHAQVVTLKTVKSSGHLLADLEKKLAEASDRVSKATSDVVELDEKIMLGRIRMEDALADLHFAAKPSGPVARAKDAP
jgi:Domain of unknown function (DUF4139)